MTGLEDRGGAFYGRRKGKRLRHGQQDLVETLLPALRLDPAKPPAAQFPDRIREIWLEIGFGGGEHLAAQAAAHPEMGFIGCEPFVNGVVSVLGHIKAHDLRNVRLWTSDARALIARLPSGSIARAFILFPDPWPKARHHKRRLIAAPFLDALARVLAHGAELRVATDDADYLEWILERLPSHPDFRPQDRADWHARPADWPPTRYEQKAIAAGRKPTYLRLVRV